MTALPYERWRDFIFLLMTTCCDSIQAMLRDLNSLKAMVSKKGSGARLGGAHNSEPIDMDAFDFTTEQLDKCVVPLSLPLPTSVE